jgi:hypothetical protein
MSIHSVQRTASLALLLVAPACSFNPSLSGPLAGSDAGGVEDARGNPGDADGPDDMSAGGDLTVADAQTDTADPPPDMSILDSGRPDAPADMNVGPTMCDGMVVDLRTNPQHCGACDNACDPDHGSCSAGRCQCELGGTACGDQNLCTTTDFDPDNCGQCDRQCADGQVCIDGDCFCRPGLRLCNGECVDPDNDPHHCGTCDNDCGGKVCVDGQCENRNNCPFGTWSCQLPDGKACVRGRQRDLHCGPTIMDPCGTTCAADEFCHDDGILSAPACVRYRPGLGCTDCPCSDCLDGESCVTTEDIPGVAFCVSQ